MIQPPQPPYFEYQNQFDSKLFQKNIFRKPLNRQGKFVMSLTNTSFMIWFFLSAPLMLITLKPEPSLTGVFLLLNVLIILYTLLLVNSVRQAELSISHRLSGKTVTSWISETHYLLSNPDNGIITAYPFSILSIIEQADEYIILESGNQRIFIRRAGLQAAGLEEKFLALVNAPKT